MSVVGTEPDSARKTAINNLISGLKSDGIWSELDSFKMYAAHEEASALLNWKAPSSNPSIKVGTPTFTIDKGFTGNGTNGYLRSGFITSVDAVNYDPSDSFAIGGYFDDISAQSGTVDIGVNSGEGNQYVQLLGLRRSDVTNNGCRYRLGETTNDYTTDIGATAGTYRMDYLKSPEGSRLIRDATVLYNGDEPGADPLKASKEFYELAYNSNGTAGNFSTNTIVCSFYGSRLLSGIHTRIAAYLTEIGY
jgi:hypothetical protein